MFDANLFLDGCYCAVDSSLMIWLIRVYSIHPLSNHSVLFEDTRTHTPTHTRTRTHTLTHAHIQTDIHADGHTSNQTDTQLDTQRGTQTQTDTRRDQTASGYYSALSLTGSMDEQHHRFQLLSD